MLQNIIILILFIASLSWLGRRVWRNFTAKSCENGCGSCSIDWKAIEEKAKTDLK